MAALTEPVVRWSASQPYLGEEGKAEADRAWDEGRADAVVSKPSRSTEFAHRPFLQSAYEDGYNAGLADLDDYKRLLKGAH